MGNENAQSLVRLQEETQNGMYDAILHVGDFAYDMNSVRTLLLDIVSFLNNSNSFIVQNDAAVGDAFMNQIQPIAAYLPYMTCPGNHEER